MANLWILGSQRFHRRAALGAIVLIAMGCRNECGAAAEEKDGIVLEASTTLRSNSAAGSPQTPFTTSLATRLRVTNRRATAIEFDRGGCPIQLLARRRYAFSGRPAWDEAKSPVRDCDGISILTTVQPGKSVILESAVLTYTILGDSLAAGEYCFKARANFSFPGERPRLAIGSGGAVLQPAN